MALSSRVGPTAFDGRVLRRGVDVAYRALRAATQPAAGADDCSCRRGRFRKFGIYRRRHFRIGGFGCCAAPCRGNRTSGARPVCCRNGGCGRTCGACRRTIPEQSASFHHCARRRRSDCVSAFRSAWRAVSGGTAARPRLAGLLARSAADRIPRHFRRGGDCACLFCCEAPPQRRKSFSPSLSPVSPERACWCPGCWSAQSAIITTLAFARSCQRRRS